MNYIKYFLLLFWSFCISPCFAQTNFTLTSPQSIGKKDILSVEEAFQMDFRQDQNTLHITWTIAPGHYLYQSKFTFDPVHASLGEIQYSKAQPHEDPYLGTQNIYKNQAHISIKLNEVQSQATVDIGYMGCAENRLCYPPASLSIPLDSLNLSAQDGFAQSLIQESFMVSLLLFFLLGVGLAFTPCVFPMYPILSSIIVRHQQQQVSKRPFWLSMAYIQGMALTYSLLGVVVALAGLQYQAAFQQPLLLGILAVLFVLLALSMFDVYQIKMPQRLEQKLQTLSSGQKTGTLTGVFLMGALSGVVASPCTTAPLSGALLYIAQTGDIAFGFSALYSLSLGMGLPLLILGSTSGRWLPQAGAWMNTIKKIFGFLLIAVSVMLIARFAPNIVVVLLWVLWSLSFLFFLFKSNQASTASPLKQARYGAIALIGIGLGVLFQKDVAEVADLTYNKVQASQATSAYTLHNDFILVTNVSELNAALLQAKQKQQPALIDMYAQWCVACKDFESITFQDSRIKKHFERMTLIKVDVTEMNQDTTQILEAYQVKGLPTLILFDKKGVRQEQLRVTGFMTPAEFNQQLTQLHK